MSSTYILVAGDARIGGLIEAAAGTDTTAVVAGTRAVADAVATSGVGAVKWLGEPAAGVPLESYAGVVADIVAAASPSLILTSTRPADRVLAGAVAARLAAPSFTSVTDIAVGDDGVELTRGAYGGIVTQRVKVAGAAVVVIDGGGLASGSAASIQEVAAAPSSALSVTETRIAERDQVDLAQAKRIVAVGRGLKAKEDIALIEQLSTALGAVTACSRPLTEGVAWFDHDRYVGVTGQHVKPDLYLAVGVSGQLQHTVGARGSGVIVAINADADCPYFAEADYCVIGDLYQVLPALTAALA